MYAFPPGLERSQRQAASSGTPDSPAAGTESGRQNGVTRTRSGGGPVSPALSFEHQATPSQHVSKPSTTASSSLSLSASASKGQAASQADVSSPRREVQDGSGGGARGGRKRESMEVVVKRAGVAEETEYIVGPAMEDWTQNNRKVKRLTRSCDWLSKSSKVVGQAKAAAPIRNECMTVWSEPLMHVDADILVLPYVGFFS